MPGGAPIAKNLKIVTITALSVIALDQITKYVIMQKLYPAEIINVVSGFFDLVYFMNTGAAFGIFNEGGALRTIFLIGTSAIALIVIGVLIKQSKSPFLTFALSLIAGGAIGNLIDRLRFGSVVDFLYFHAGRWYWPAFNVADTAITVGVAFAILSHYLSPRED